MKVKLLSDIELGAVISGIDLLDLSSDSQKSIRELLWKYKVLCFHTQDLSFRDLSQVASVFGEIFKTPAQGQALSNEFPWIQRVIRDKDSQPYFLYGGGWHSDNAALETRPAYTMLYSVKAPSIGGNTRFKSQTLVYETVSDSVKETLQDASVGCSWTQTDLRTAFFSNGTIPFGSDSFHSKVFTEEEYKSMCKDIPKFVEVDKDFKDKKYVSYQKAVIQHPHTKERVFNISPSYTNKVRNCSEENSKEWIAQVVQTQMESSVVEVQWSDHMITIWDNRLVLHQATESDPLQERIMFRVMIADPEDKVQETYQFVK